MNTIYSRCALAMMGAGLCWLAEPMARAGISVTATSQFGDFTIDPSGGNIIYLSSWQSSAFAQAGANAQYNSGSSSAAGSTDVPVPGGSAAGSGAAASGGTGSSGATASIPGSIAGFDTSAGRASLSGGFEITGASAPVNVIFSVEISGQLTLSSDPYGVYAQGENVFALTVNGQPVLFNDQILSIGPGESESGSYSNILTATMTLVPDEDYYFWGEADSEALVINASQPAVPEPAAGGLWSASVALLVLVGSLLRRSVDLKRKKANGLMLSTIGMLLLVLPAEAKYLGSDPPDVCLTCGTKPTRMPAGTVNTSLSEGNLREDYPVVKVLSAYGPTMPFGLTYNSYNADGSKAQLDTGLGFGWTHTYNAMLFQQRGQMFRMDADGRVTQYYLNYFSGGTSYISDTGYFESLTMLTDGSFMVTNKNQSWWHFGLVPNTPFLVAGPVYRLLQMGDRNGNTETMSYTKGLLASVTDPYGRTLQFTYDTSNHLSSVTDPAGRTTSFKYDPLERVPMQITDPAGNTVTYGYNAQYQMTRKVDRDGRTYFYMYKDLLPYAVADSIGQPWFSMSNPDNWAVNETNLAFSLQRHYIPSTTVETDGNGQVWRYAYDTNGYVTQVTAPDGAITAYTFDSATRMVASLTDADGHTTRYQYDADGNRLSMTDALGEVTTYTYEPVFNQLTSLTDPNGRTTVYQYDAHGNRLYEIDPLNETNSWTYDAHGNVTSATDKRGNTTTFTYDAFGNGKTMTDPLGNVTTYAYDAIGNRVSTIDALGRITHYQFDTLDRMIGLTNALNGVTSYTYDPLGRRLSTTDPNTNTTTHQYDLRGRLIQTTDALGGTTRYGYDADDNRIAITNQLGHPTTYAYDVQNRLAGTTNPIGGVMRYTYDPVGNCLSSTDPNTNVTTYAYDALNRLAAYTNALGGVTSYDYAMPGGPPCCSPTIGSALITRTEDADGNVTFYHYDELNRRVLVNRKNSDTNDVSNPTDAVTVTAYDADNNVIAVTDPNGNTTVYTFDEDNRRTSVVDAADDTTILRYDPVGNLITTTAPNDNTTTNEYDALDRLVTVVDEIGMVRSNTYDADGNLLSTTDGLGHTTRYNYDDLNRRVEAIDPLGQTTATAYDPDSNLISMTDRNGHVTQYSYDDLDRRTSTTDALGHTTVTTYDPDNNVIGLTDANGHTTRCDYDGLNRRITETYPDTPPNTRTNIYDAVGNLIERVDQKGQITIYSYNDLYYLTNRAYSPSGDYDRFTYDDGGRMLTGDRNGWVDTFAYDAANRLTNTVQNGRVLTYTYDIPDRVQTNTQPSGRVLNYTYDARNRLVTLQDGTPNPPIVTYDYDDADRVVTRGYRNGTTATYAYNPDNWVISLVHSNGPSLIAGFSYAYDHEGNKFYEQKVDLTAGSEAYAYDALDRLTNYDVGMFTGSTIPTPIVAKAWNLDPVGNWSMVTSNGVPEIRTYGLANELLTANGSNFLYDADGNLAQDNTFNYTYDAENRLIQVQRRADSAVVGQYLYDALGRRVEKIADPAFVPATYFYFFDGARIVEEQDAGGATLADYTYGNYVDEVLTMDRAGESYYYHQNALFSPYALSDGTGGVVERYTYDVYGNVTVLDAGYTPLLLNPWGTPHSPKSNRFLFTGRELDEETGVYYYRARYLDDGKGRFLQRDPLEYVDGPNLYEYARSKPTHYTDPSGAAIVCAGISGSAGVGGAVSGSASLCTDNCRPSRTAVVVCFGLGGGVGAAIGGGGTVGQGCLSAGWSTQITVQGSIGPIGLSGSAGLDTPGVPVSGGVNAGPSTAVAVAVTIERCYTRILPPVRAIPPRVRPERPPPTPCCQCYVYGLRKQCTPGKCNWCSNTFPCRFATASVNADEQGTCRDGTNCQP